METQRLVMRRWRPADLEPFAALNADPAVVEHLPGPLDRAASDAFVDRIARHFDAHGYGLWAVEVKGGAPCIGFVGLGQVAFEAPFVPAVEIGWRLARSAWGRGFASEAARRALAFGFEEAGLEEIVSFTVPHNTRSRAVMERIGLAHDPVEDFDHPKLPVGDPLRRHVLYRLDRDTWRARDAPRTADG